MPTNVKNFLDFISEAKRDTVLTNEFLNQQSVKALKDFFDSHDYYGITKAQCEKLLYFKKHMPNIIKDFIDDKGAY